MYIYLEYLRASVKRGMKNAEYGKAKQSKAKMCNGRRHVPLCPACANEKKTLQKCNYNTIVSSAFIRLLLPNPVNSTGPGPGCCR